MAIKVLCQCQNISNDNISEIILLLIGALIAFVSSIGTIIIQKKIDEHGKINLFYKFINVKTTEKAWGFYSFDNLTQSLIIPAVFELQNTTNTTRVIRDVCLYLYNGNSKVCKMVQAEYTAKKGVIDDSFGGVNNSYSFVLPPRSIQKVKCEFLLNVSNSEIEKYSFDKIVIKYYDEKNRKKNYTLKTMKDIWNKELQKVDEEWIIIE